MLKGRVKLRSRQVGTLIVVVLINSFNLFCFDVVSADITIDGETIHAETDGYVVQFDKGVITYIHNKYTNTAYTLPGEGTRGWTGLLHHRHFWRDENTSTSRAILISATQISPLKAELLFRQDGTDVQLFISIDPITHDLLIDMEGVSDTPGVVGMQWGIGYLDIRKLSIIAPVDGGRVIDATSSAYYHDYFYPGSGLPGWEAQLAIIQGERGGFYIRNTDNTFQFKRFICDRPENGLALNFGTYNQAPFDSHTTGQSRLWRFNTYAGDWRVPARIYRDWMEQAFQPQRLSDMPAWMEDITLVVGSAKGGPTPEHATLPDRLAELVEPQKTLLFVGTWADGGEWWTEGKESHLPDYIPKPELKRFVEVSKQYGFRVMLYLIVQGFSPNHPLYPDFQQYQYRDTWTGELLGAYWNTPPTHPATHRQAFISPASSKYRKLLVERLKSVWEEHSVDGFFLDTSHFVINDGNGLIDGLNMAQGMALLHKELAEAMPGIALGGERLHEATFAHESFAQRPLLTDRLEPHPISAFLFSPFVHAIGFGPTVPHHDPALHHEILRYGEIWDVIPTLNIWGPGHLAEERSVEIDQILELAGNWQHQYGLNGDINGDGTVNVLDLTLVARNVGIMPLTHLQTDVNGDGVVNLFDLILVANMFDAAR